MAYLYMTQVTNVVALFGVALISVVAASIGALFDRSRKAVFLMCDLDDHSLAVFEKFSDEFDKLGNANRIWNISTLDRTSDWKRNAGAQNLITRKPAYLSHNTPRVVKTNINPPCVLGGNKNIYFFPDTVFVSDGGHIGAIDYDQLSISFRPTVFIEDDGVPSNSQVVGQTWRFVNRDGGPDRRFNNNRVLPKALYQEATLTSSSGFQKILQISRVEDRAAFDAALVEVRQLIKKLGRAS